MAKKIKIKATRSRSEDLLDHSLLRKDFECLVGNEVYSTWIKMLKSLVPFGRTERLSVLVASMLQYAASVKSRGEKGNSVVRILEESANIGMDYEDQGPIILPLIETLFKDAKVKWKRTNARDHGYSIAEEALDQFLRWDFMPWE